MSGDVMSFPPSWEDFAEQYSFNDSDEVYTNGSRLMQLCRVEQMVKHYFAEPLTRPMVTRCRDCKHLVAYPDAKYCAGLSSAFFEVSDEDFCAWALRKEGGDD